MTVLAGVAVVVAACSSSTIAPETTSGDPGFDTGDLGVVEVITVTVDDAEATVAVASTSETRSRGLRGVTDLGDLDGMIFVWGGETVTSTFTMADTLIALDISFFDAEGRFVDGFTMSPCKTSNCPPYAAAGPFAYAIEVPAGSRPLPGPGSVLRLPG
jgi:uncharacterized membrane protein (UPF0127 family)